MSDKKIAKPFHFKQFSVEQDKCALKVNTDAVLLGAIASASKPQNILEIGTGTGVISLMLAQRFTEAIIHGVEIEEDAYNQAGENFKNSPWHNRMEMFLAPFQYFTKNKDFQYDLIVSNPPYFQDHLKTNSLSRNIALHAESLTFPELAYGVEKQLAPKGAFWVILPERQMLILEDHLLKTGLVSQNKVYIYDRPGTPTLRVVQSFGFLKSGAEECSIYIKDANQVYSSGYASLLKDFLLIF